MGDDISTFSPYVEMNPYKLEAYDVTDISILTWFSTNLGKGKFSSGKKDDNSYPIEVSIELNLSNGVVVQSPKSTCIYIESVGK